MLNKIKRLETHITLLIPSTYDKSSPNCTEGNQVENTDEDIKHSMNLLQFLVISPNSPKETKKIFIRDIVLGK